MYDKTEIGKLVRNLQKGDMDAFGELYQMTYSTAMMQARLYSKTAAEDLVQSAYLRAYEKIDQLKNPEEFVAWLKMIITNSAKNYVVRESRHITESDQLALDENNTEKKEKIQQEEYDRHPEKYDPFIPDKQVDYTATKEIVWAMIEELPYEQKAVIDYRFYQGLSIEETAAAIGCLPRTVKSRFAAAKKKLQTTVEEEERQSGVKLHCEGALLIPFLIWLFREKETEAMANAVMPPTGSFENLCKQIKKEGLEKRFKKNTKKQIRKKTRKIGRSAWKGIAAGGVAVVAAGGVIVVPRILEKNTVAEEETLIADQFTVEEIQNYIIEKNVRRSVSIFEYTENLDSKNIVGIHVTDAGIGEDTTKLLNVEMDYEENGNVTKAAYQVRLERNFASLPWNLFWAVDKGYEIVERNPIGTWTGKMRIDDPSKNVDNPAYYADRDVTITIDSYDGTNISGHIHAVSDGFVLDSDLTGTFENDYLKLTLTDPLSDDFTSDKWFIFYYRFSTDEFCRNIYGDVIGRAEEK
jgi:RNA polymerase sigma-70 factor (ECF subfamily)